MSDVKKKKYLNISFLLLLFFVLSCTDREKEVTPNRVEENSVRKVTRAKDFENLVMVDSLGVTGADGVISFPLDSFTSVFMMGDSFLTPVHDKKRDVNSRMINNTFILINEKEGIHTAFYKGTSNDADALLKPTYGNDKEYYWPGNGFEKRGIIHIFMSRFLHGDYDWGFEFSGTDYIRMDSTNFDVISQEDFPYSNINGVHYGHSVINENEFTYIYGAWSTKDSTALHVARAKLDSDFNKLGEFQFFDGSDWVSEPMKSVPLSGIEQQVPEQFSVFKYGDLYVLLLQARELGNGNIFSYFSDSPTGPWCNEKLLYHTTEQENTEDQVFTYNAMAHPQYIKDNKLLVSYCVNSFEVSNIHEINTDYYRPRFIWVPMEMILD